MATTMLETLASLLGLPVRAIPLSSCRITRPYLLERVGIPIAGTALLFAVPYVMCCDVADPARDLSLYAVPRDYHAYMRGLEKTLLPSLQKAFPDICFSLFSDHSPIAEVNAAARAGLGVRGDNGLLLTPDYGSFVFIAEVCTDADYATVAGTPAPDFPVEPPKCEGCGACRRACPVKDAECLSALTQKKGILTPAETDALRAHSLVWGCDTCQTVCPHNRQVLAEGRDTPIRYFRENRLSRLDIPTLDAMDAETFAARAYAWRGRAVIRRNLILKEEEI